MARSNGQERGSAGVTLAILAATVAALIIILIGGRTRPNPVALTTPKPTRTPEPSAAPAPITVYVTGAVANPNRNYTLPPASRVEEAIAAAGGTLDDADLTGVNLADVLRDGVQIHVPQIAQPAPASLPTPIGGTTVAINTATADELDALPGVGPALARRIVEYRTLNGPFASLEDLDNVNGIGPALLDDLRDRVRFD